MILLERMLYSANHLLNINLDFFKDTAVNGSLSLKEQFSLIKQISQLCLIKE